MATYCYSLPTNVDINNETDVRKYAIRLSFATHVANRVYDPKLKEEYKWIKHSKYLDSIFKVMDDAIDVALNKGEGNDKVEFQNGVAEFKGTNPESYTNANKNAVLLYSWIFMNINQNTDKYVDIKKVVERIKENGKYQDIDFSKAESDIRGYGQALTIVGWLKWMIANKINPTTLSTMSRYDFNTKTEIQMTGGTDNENGFRIKFQKNYRIRSTTSKVSTPKDKCIGMAITPTTNNDNTTYQASLDNVEVFKGHYKKVEIVKIYDGQDVFKASYTQYMEPKEELDKDQELIRREYDIEKLTTRWYRGSDDGLDPNTAFDFRNVYPIYKTTGCDDKSIILQSIKITSHISMPIRINIHSFKIADNQVDNKNIILINGKYEDPKKYQCKKAREIMLGYMFHIESEYSCMVDLNMHEVYNKDSDTAIKLKLRNNKFSSTFKFDPQYNHQISNIDFYGIDNNKQYAIREMFYGAKNQTTAKNVDKLTKGMTNTSAMFYVCESLEYCTPTNKIISSMDIKSGQPINIEHMFAYTALTYIDLSHIDFTQINKIDVSYLFYKCNSIKTIDLRGTKFHDIETQTIGNMFRDCNKIQTIKYGGATRQENGKNVELNQNYIRLNASNPTFIKN